MRVLLIDPPFYRFIGYFNRYFPLGLSSLAAAVRAAGHEVLVYDADANRRPFRMDYTRMGESYPAYLGAVNDPGHPAWAEARAVIRAFAPDVVGISVWTLFVASAVRLAATVKSALPGVPVVAGGPHATIAADELLRAAHEFDCAVRGEAEETLPRLLPLLSGGGDLRGIPGVSFRTGGDIVHNPDAPFLQDLDTAPFPAREMLHHRRVYDAEDMGLLLTSRGCPFRCSYCATAMWRRVVRYRSPDHVIAEIRAVRARYGTVRFALKDDSFTVDPDRTAAFCERLLSAGVRISWECNMRADQADAGLLRLMRRAGCDSVKVGIESGSPRVLELMRKGITLEQSRRAARLFREVGLHWTGYFLVGIPSETAAEMERTLDFMRELDPDMALLGVYEAYPGTELFKHGVDAGIVLPSLNRDLYFSRTPDDLYLREPGRRSDALAPPEFARVVGRICREFHRHNRHPRRLFRLGRTRVPMYLADPRAALGDLRKLAGWWR